MDSSFSSSPPQPKKIKMSTTTSDDENPNPSTSETKKQRFKRRKIAIFLAYCGVGYQGMQKNPGAKTIESDLEEALFLSGAVPEPDRGNPKRFDWARSARTDKGVSAVGQVVSGRFYIDPPGLVDRLSSHLPDQIRIFGYKRVTASFNAKKFCDRRRYVYLLPVFALDPNSHPDRESVVASVGSENELLKCSECSDRGRKVVGLMGRRGTAEASKKTADDGNASALESRVLETGVETEGTTENSGGPALEFKVCREEGKTEVTIEIAEKNAGSALESGNSSEELRIQKTERTAETNGSPALECSFSCEEGKKEKNEEIAENFYGPALDSRVSSEEEKTEKNVPFLGNEEQTAPSNGREFRYGEKERERFNGILKHYVGTHNFHNLTTRTKAEDPSARRYIVSFSAVDVVNIDGMEFIRCEVVGQSFMLHQIRKMIGLAVAVMRNCAPESLIDTALKKDINVNVPTAPEVGLYLDECMFTSYNHKWKDSHEELSMEAYVEQARDFKMNHIYSHISSMEQKEGVMALWLHSLNHRNYPDLRLVETNGTCTDMQCTQEANTGE